jgi:nucleoside-diphosphate-sugar epimerase
MVSVKGVVELMKKYHGAKRFVLGSTGGVCAPSEELVNEEELRRPDATPYHSYKFGMELASEAIADTEGCDLVILRYYWPWSAHNGFPHTWIIVPQLRGQPVSINEKHPNRFTPMFMPDCVRYTIELAKLTNVPRIVNVSGPDIVSVEEMAEVSADVLGVEPQFVNGRKPVHSFLGDPSLLLGLLGPPEYDVRRSIEAAVQWHREHPEEAEKRNIFDAPRNW